MRNGPVAAVAAEHTCSSILGSWYTYYGNPSGAQYVTPQTHASSVILLFSNPAPKTKNWDCKQTGARLLINRKAFVRIIMIGQSKQGAPARSDHIHYTSYRAGTQLCCAFYQSERKL
jgi:hypothetical protein